MSNLNDVVGAPACGTTDPAPACGTKGPAPACGTACDSADSKAAPACGSAKLSVGVAAVGGVSCAAITCAPLGGCADGFAAPPPTTAQR